MKEKVYITGHKNPDTDTICAAICYSDLKNKRGDVEAFPIRLGELSQETKWVLNRWGFEPPKLVNTLKLTIGDLEFEKPICVTPDISINKAAKFLEEHDLRSLPVVDDKEELVGIVTLSNLTKSYMEVWDDKILWRAHTPIDNMVDTISGSIINYPEKVRDYDGRILVYASRVDENGRLNKGDIAIVGDREDVHLEAVEKEVSILILTSGAKIRDDILQKIKEKNICLISTKYNSYMVSRLLPQAIPVSYVMSTESLMYFYPDDYVEEVLKKVRNNRFRSFPILNRYGKVIGHIARNDLILDKKKKLILVDHNERSQSIDDIESVEITEIIDHHRVANVNTSGPIFFRNIPVGSTCTILAMMYFEQGVTPNKEIAGLMASAIISDTLMFRSPTTTDIDKQILMRLSRIADIDPQTYASEMFSAGTSLVNQKPEDILLTDSKVFTVGQNYLRVSQMFTTNLDKIGQMEDSLISSMRQILDNSKENIFCLLMTDIFAEKSKVIVAGDYGKEIAKEFNVEYKEKGFMVNDLLSRKKQFIPSVTAAIVRAEA